MQITKKMAEVLDDLREEFTWDDGAEYDPRTLYPRVLFDADSIIIFNEIGSQLVQVTEEGVYAGLRTCERSKCYAFDKLPDNFRSVLKAMEVERDRAQMREALWKVVYAFAPHGITLMVSDDGSALEHIDITGQKLCISPVYSVSDAVAALRCRYMELFMHTMDDRCREMVAKLEKIGDNK